MSRTLLYALIILLNCVVLKTNAQSFNSKKVNGVAYKNNVKQSLNNDEKELLLEVYGEHLHSNILNHPQRLKDLKNILRNRVSVLHLANYSKPCELLSQVPLFNKYNSELKRDVFNKDTFNPLKYNFDFYSKGTIIYRVDNTDYYVVIKSQYQK